MKKKFIHVCGIPSASPWYTATPARLAASAERERADPAAGRLNAATAWYTALGPRYTAGGGADDELGRRSLVHSLRNEAKGANGVGQRPAAAASRSSKSFGLRGP
jgi:hypothetical protein